MNEEMDPELLDDDVHRMEQEESPCPHPGLIYQPIEPLIKDKTKYQKLYDCFLQPEQAPYDIQPDTVYFDRERKQIKFLLLKNALSYGVCMPAKLALMAAEWGDVRRVSAGSQPNPKKITWGFFPQTPGHVIGSGYKSIRNQPTLEQPALAHCLRGLVKAMNARLAEYLPTYYPKALQHALHAEQRDDVPEDDWTRIPKGRPPEHEAYDAKVRAAAVDGLDEPREDHPDDYVPDPVGLVKGIDGPWPGFLYTLWGTVFSTLELNKSILFKAHADKNNIKSDLICIAALGDWVGGRFVFPRYGYGADLEETDLLICDNANEFHGNLGPLVTPQKSGRFSVVAFMHSSILDYANRVGQWAPKTSANTQETPSTQCSGSAGNGEGVLPVR